MLNAFDVERVVRELDHIPLREVGSTRWFAQHRTWEQLNQLSHTAAASNAEDTSLSALLTWEKLPLAISGILSVEAWRLNVYPRIKPTIARRDPSTGPLRAYFIHYHEAVLVNLLETCLYHDYAAEALGDALLDLIDYAARQVAGLIADTHAKTSLTAEQRAEVARMRAVATVSALTRSTPAVGGITASPLLSLASNSSISATASSGSTSERGILIEGDPDLEASLRGEIDEDDEEAEVEESADASSSNSSSSDSRKNSAKLSSNSGSGSPVAMARIQMRRWERSLSFSIGISCVSILRYLCEHAPKLPLSALTRLTDKHDVALLMVPLVENPPWVRRRTRSVRVTAKEDAATPSSSSSSSSSSKEDEKSESTPSSASSFSSPALATTKKVVVWEKFVSRAWVDVPVSNLLRLTPNEGQPWLALYALLQEPEIRKRYALSRSRTSNLLRLRKYLNEVLVDQLPPLIALQRTLEELVVVGEHGASSSTSGGSGGKLTNAPEGNLLLETLPLVQEAIIREALATATSATFASLDTDGAWLQIAEWIVSNIFVTREDARGSAAGAALSLTAAPLAAASDITGLSALYHDDAWLEATAGPPKCSSCHAAGAGKKCGRCKNAWYCSRECQVAHWKEHKAICDVVAASATATEESSEK